VEGFASVVPVVVVEVAAFLSSSFFSEEVVVGVVVVAVAVVEEVLLSSDLFSVRATLTTNSLPSTCLYHYLHKLINNGYEYG